MVTQSGNRYEPAEAVKLLLPFAEERESLAVAWIWYVLARNYERMEDIDQFLTFSDRFCHGDMSATHDFRGAKIFLFQRRIFHLRRRGDDVDAELTGMLALDPSQTDLNVLKEAGITHLPEETDTFGADEIIDLPPPEAVEFSATAITVQHYCVQAVIGRNYTKSPSLSVVNRCEYLSFRNDAALIRNGKYFRGLYVSDMLKRSRRAMLDIAKAPTRLNGTGVVVSDQFSPDNYCHWLLDWLPRILLAVNHVGSVNWIFARIGRLPFQIESLRMIPELAKCHLIVDEGVQWYALDRAITVDNLKIPMTHPAWGANRAVVQMLRSSLLERKSDTGALGLRKRLYITRLDTGGRRIVINDQELRDMLATFGFESVSLGGRSIADQAAIFANCEAVIGVHGAGLTNMLYMQPGSIAVELFHYRYGTSAYAKLANTLGLKYFYMSCNGLPGSAAPDTEGIAHSNSHIESSIWVDPAILRVSLSSAGL